MMRRYMNSREASGTYSIRQLWLRVIVTTIITLVAIFLYGMNLQIPDGVLIIENDLERFQTNYEQIIDGVSDYHMPYSYEVNKAKIIIAKQGCEQVLYHELRRAYPSADISFLQMERRVRLQTIELIWIILAMHILLAALRSVWPRAKGYFTYGIVGFGFLLLCYYIKARFLLPSQWIPESLIDFKGWRTNMEQYKLSSTTLDHWYSSQETLWMVLGIGLALYIVISSIEMIRRLKNHKHS